MSYLHRTSPILLLGLRGGGGGGEKVVEGGGDKESIKWLSSAEFSKFLQIRMISFNSSLLLTNHRLSYTKYLHRAFLHQSEVLIQSVPCARLSQMATLMSKEGTINTAHYTDAYLNC